MADHGNNGRKVEAFLNWRARRGGGNGEAVGRIARELLDLADGEAVSEWHVAALIRRYREHMSPPGALRAIGEIGDDVCLWAMERAATARGLASPVPPAGDFAALASLKIPADTGKLPDVDLDLPEGHRLASSYPPKPARSQPPPALRLAAGPWTVAHVGRPATIPPATLPPELDRRRKKSPWRTALYALVGVVAIACICFGVRAATQDRSRRVEGPLSSKHLGVSMTLEEAWSQAIDRDADETKDGWRHRSSVFFRGANVGYFDAEMIVVTLARTDGGAVSEADVRSEGASETVGIVAADRDCSRWKKQKNGTLCNSVIRQGGRIYNGREYMFTSGNRVIYLLTMYEVRRPKNSGDVDATERQNSAEMTEANAIAESIEAI